MTTAQLSSRDSFKKKDWTYWVLSGFAAGTIPRRDRRRHAAQFAGEANRSGLA